MTLSLLDRAYNRRFLEEEKSCATSEMFGDVVDPSVKVGSQKWYTVPLSIVVHTALIGAVIIIPLMAADVLPTSADR